MGMIQDYQLAAAQWTLLAFTFSLVCLRLYFRVYLRRTWHWSDVFVSLAWLFSLAFAIELTIMWKLGFFSSNNPNIPPQIPIENLVTALKVNYAIGTMYFLSLYLVKISMLCFYDELIGKALMFKTWVALRCLAAFVVVGWVFSVCEFLFYCKDISDNWSIDPDNKCFGVGYDVKISGIMKIGVGILFFIGFITIINGFVYFALSFFAPQVGLWAPFSAVWEQTCSLTIACCPAFKALILTKGPEFKHFLRRGKRFWRRCPEDVEHQSPPRRVSPLDGPEEENRERRNSPERKASKDVMLSDLSVSTKSKPSISTSATRSGTSRTFSDNSKSLIASPLSTLSSGPTSPAAVETPRRTVPESSVPMRIDTEMLNPDMITSASCRAAGDRRGHDTTPDSDEGKTFFEWS